MTLGKRILMFFHWLLSLLICAALVVYALAPDFVKNLFFQAEANLGYMGVRVLGGAILAIYLALSGCQAYLIFKRAKRVERGFINVDSGDAGQVRIAVSAIEQLVRQSVVNIEGITEMKIDIASEGDAISIAVNASIQSGSHVPTLTMNMQRSIRQFVEMNCGVAVRSVSISINAVSNPEAPSSRRHRGLGRADRIKPAASAPATPAAPEPEAPATVESVPAEPAPEAAADTAEPPAFDLDKPYESEFAKDLAAMKAAEAEAEDGKAI